MLRRRTVHKASATSVGRKDSPEPQREVQQLRVGLTSLEEDKRLTSGSAEESAKLSGVVRSGVLKAEETQKRGREGQVEGQTGEQETNKIKDSSPATTTTTTTTTTLTKASTTTTTATTINPTTPTSAAEAINTSRSAIGEGASKSSVEEEPVAVAPKTGKKEKRKTFKFKKSGKDKRYKQKEMEDEVAEPPAHMEVNPELVLLLKMTPLVEDKEEEDEVTDL